MVASWIETQATIFTHYQDLLQFASDHALDPGSSKITPQTHVDELMKSCFDAKMKSVDAGLRVQSDTFTIFDRPLLSEHFEADRLGIHLQPQGNEFPDNLRLSQQIQTQADMNYENQLRVLLLPLDPAKCGSTRAAQKHIATLAEGIIAEATKFTASFREEYIQFGLCELLEKGHKAKEIQLLAETMGEYYCHRKLIARQDNEKVHRLLEQYSENLRSLVAEISQAKIESEFGKWRDAQRRGS